MSLPAQQWIRFTRQGKLRPQVGWVAVFVPVGLALAYFVLFSAFVIGNSRRQGDFWLYDYLVASVPLHGWSRPGFAVEVGLLAYLSAVVATFQRRRWLAVVSGTAFLFALYSLCFASYLTFGESLSYGDLFATRDLIDALPWKYLLPMISASLAVAALLLGNFHWPGLRRAGVVLLPAAVYLGGVHVRPDLVFAGIESLRPTPGFRPDLEIFKDGPLCAFLKSHARFLEFERVLDADVPKGADAVSLPLNEEPVLARRPDIYLIVMESFVDPLNFRAARFDRDPMDSRLRRWLSESASVSLSPVYGGKSARAEFELLCGLPSYALGGIDFNSLRGARIPCLPELLHRMGYETLSSQPVSSSFFNYRRAYPAVGFESIHFADSYDLDDLDGQWLAAESQLRQVRHQVDKWNTEKPRLVYTFLNAGHHPFAMNRKRRPPRFPGDAWPARIANAIYYDSAAVADYVEWIEARDPNAVVVIVGDHLPALGAGFGAYRKRGYRLASEDTGARPFSDGGEVRDLVSRATPLVVRRAGRTIPVGVVAHYEIPEVLLNLLTDGEHCRRHPCSSRDPVVFRPIEEAPLFAERAHFPAPVCAGGEPQPGCAEQMQRHRRDLSAYRKMMRLGSASTGRSGPQ